VSERRLYQLPWHAYFEARWCKRLEDLTYHLDPAREFVGDGVFAVQLALGEVRGVAIVGDWPAVPVEWRLEACQARARAGKLSIGADPIP
jgi:hypothetical protein